MWGDDRREAGLEERGRVEELQANKVVGQAVKGGVRRLRLDRALEGRAVRTVGQAGRVS